MEVITNIRKALDSPKYAARFINRKYFSLTQGEDYYQKGVDVLKEDWDNLIILDGCRFDTFQAHTDWEAPLEYRYSRGASTFEFLTANFTNKVLNDTVYINANPQFYNNREDLQTKFHSCIDVWRDDGWDKDQKTVLPETTTTYALTAAKKHPNKRLIIHYMQPHYPFIGSDTYFDKKQLHSSNKNRRAFWNEILTGELEVSDEKIKKLYSENLIRTLPHVRDLLTELNGKTVITSDHGNAIGERSFPIPIREWGHPTGIYMEEILKVPWLELQNGDRKDIQAGQEAKTDDDIDDDIVDERLQDLGYMA